MACPESLGGGVFVCGRGGGGRWRAGQSSLRSQVLRLALGAPSRKGGAGQTSQSVSFVTAKLLFGGGSSPRTVPGQCSGSEHGTTGFTR